VAQFLVKRENDLPVYFVFVLCFFKDSAELILLLQLSNAHKFYNCTTFI